MSNQGTVRLSRNIGTSEKKLLECNNWLRTHRGFTYEEGFSRYSKPGYQVYFLDLLLHFVPVPEIPFSLYGFLGLGGDTEKYSPSGAIFPQWNGEKSITEFVYSYGLGSRLFAIKHLFGRCDLPSTILIP